MARKQLTEEQILHLLENSDEEDFVELDHESDFGWVDSDEENAENCKYFIGLFCSQS